MNLCPSQSGSSSGSSMSQEEMSRETVRSPIWQERVPSEMAVAPTPQSVKDSSNTTVTDIAPADGETCPELNDQEGHPGICAPSGWMRAVAVNESPAWTGQQMVYGASRSIPTNVTVPEVDCPPPPPPLPPPPSGGSGNPIGKVTVKPGPKDCADPGAAFVRPEMSVAPSNHRVTVPEQALVLSGSRSVTVTV